jgi:hypothetical protein
MMTSKTAGGWATLTCELVVATEAVAQNTQPNNYSDMLTMMDNLSSALRGSIGTIGRSKVEWDISEDGGERIRVGGVAYWGVVATVTAY